jgi:EmrB/QacA subfamily drug resistance transporter
MTTSIPAPCDENVPKGAHAQGSAHPRATLAATILGSSLAFVDGSVVNVALPTLGRDLHASDAELAWAINAYLLPLGALILLGGAAGDHFGRRRLFIIGVGLFLLASVLCALAPSFEWLLIGRGLQGLGAALLMPNSLAILGASFIGEARGRAIGTWAATGAIAGALGPLIGGWLVDAVGWRSIFLVNLPLGAAAVWLVVTYVEESRDRNASQPLDWSGAALVSSALALITWSLTAAAELGTSRVLVALAGVFGALLMAAFLWVEGQKGARAMMPFALFATRAFIGLTILTFFLYAAMGGLFVLLPFLLIRVAGFSAIEAGAALLPLPLLIGVGSRAMGKLTAKLGGKLPLGVGAATVAVGLALFWRVGAEVSYWSELLPAIVTVAVGMAISVAPLTTSVLSSVDADHVGAASGFNSAVARVGGLIATALLGFVFVHQAEAGAFVAGFHAAALIGAAAALLAALSAFLLVPASE